MERVQKSAEGFLRQVLYQILDQRKQLFVLIYSFFTEKREQQKRSKDKSEDLADVWTLSTLQEALTLIGRKSTFEVNICLFVDALDEHDGNHRELLLILRRIAKLNDNSLFRVRLALAGRPENVFKTDLQCCPGFSIHEYTTNDIRHYAEGRIQANMRGSLTAEGDKELSNLVERIVQKARGVFLWVKLVVNEIVEGLCEGDTVRELETLLSTIPTELGELYTRTLRRCSRGSLQALTRDRNEAYVMFQIASCARTPFLLYEFLVATFFLTTGKDSYPELQTLSKEQLGRRLNSRAAGLLEVPRIERGPVQFIHQTVKEFIITGNGVSVIREGLSHRPLESGFALVFRYILKLFECFTSEVLDLDAQRFVIENFMYYARVLESREKLRVADSFELKTLGLSEQVQHDILTQILDAFYERHPEYRCTNLLSSMRQNNRMKFSLFYLLCNLPMSLKKSLSTHRSSMKREECYTLLQAAASVKCHARVLRILVEEGVVARVSEDGSQYTDNVNDLLSRLHGELPESETSNFTTQEEIESKSE